MADHTPGPWRAVPDPDKPGTLIFAPEGPQGGCYVATMFRGSATDNANTQLIAAAPDTAAERDRLKATVAELVEALERMTTSFEAAKEGRHGSELTASQIADVKTARDALARAAQE